MRLAAASNRPIRLAVTVALVTVFAATVAACGSSRTSSSSTTAAARVRDRDNDFDNNDDDAHVLDYGHAATGAERRELEALVTGYYKASAAANGSMACRLLMPFVAESVVEEFSHETGLSGHTCATVMSKLLAQRHKLLEGESSTLKFVAIRLGEGRALDVLSFAVLPEVRQITARRDGSHWKILNLRDRILE